MAAKRYFCSTDQTKQFMKPSKQGRNKLREFFRKHIGNPVDRVSGLYATNAIERQRFSVLMFSTLGILLIVPLNVLGLLIDTEPVFVKINTVWLALLLILDTAFLKRIISLAATLKIQIYLAQFTFSAAMVYSAFHAGENYYRVVILGDMVLSVAMLMLSLISHFKHTPHAMSFIIFATYLACSVISENKDISNLLPLFTIICVLISFLGVKLLDDFKGLQMENTELHEDEKTLKRLLGLDKRQAMELLKLGKEEKPSEKQTIRLLSIMDDQSRERLFAAVNDHLVKKNTQLATIAEALPELSASETEICRLILQGKKQSEICATLGKTQGNITSQRTHIRAKLNLKPKDNLGEALLKRLKEHRADNLPPKNFSV